MTIKRMLVLVVGLFMLCAVGISGCALGGATLGSEEIGTLELSAGFDPIAGFHHDVGLTEDTGGELFSFDLKVNNASLLELVVSKIKRLLGFGDDEEEQAKEQLSSTGKSHWLMVNSKT